MIFLKKKKHSNNLEKPAIIPTYIYIPTQQVLLILKAIGNRMQEFYIITNFKKKIDSAHLRIISFEK